MLAKRNEQVLTGGKEALKVKKKILIGAILVIGLCFMISSAHAALINAPLKLPRILSNTTGIYNYTASDGFMVFTGTPLSITYDGVNQIDIDADANKDQFFRANLLLNDSGGFVGGAGGEGLAIVGAVEGGASGTLLTGRITNFGFEDVGGPIALFDFTFEVTGGELAADFGGIGAIGTNSIWVSDSSFSDSWKTNHSGKDVTHKTAPVPIPSAVVLFGFGLAGLVAVRRRFHK
jgi:hypothetical protein